jgi:hypothetical protein
MKRKSVKVILSLIVGMTLFLMLGTGFVGTLNADPLGNSENGNPVFLERLAERFDLDIDEIKDFVEELREEKKIEMEAKFEEKLDELVEDGDITIAQKEAILEKKEEMEGFKEGLEDMTVSEAREALKEMKLELKSWAEDNDIELKYLFPKAAKEMGPKGCKTLGFGCGR